MLWLAHGFLVNKFCQRRCRQANFESQNIKIISNLSLQVKDNWFYQNKLFKNSTDSLLISPFRFCRNKKAFQAVLSSRESDRESIGDCYVT